MEEVKFTLIDCREKVIAYRLIILNYEQKCLKIKFTFEMI